MLREKDVPGHPSSRYYISGPTFETVCQSDGRAVGRRGPRVSIKKDVPGQQSSRHYILGPTFETGVSGGGEVHGVCSIKKDVPGHPSRRYYISGPTSETVCQSDGRAVGRRGLRGLLIKKDVPGHPSRYFISGPTFETGVSVRWKGGGAGGGEVHGGGALGVAQAVQ